MFGIENSPGGDERGFTQPENTADKVENHFGARVTGRMLITHNITVSQFC